MSVIERYDYEQARGTQVLDCLDNLMDRFIRIENDPDSLESFRKVVQDDVAKT